jgi:hypothetical protein
MWIGFESCSGGVGDKMVEFADTGVEIGGCECAVFGGNTGTDADGSMFNWIIDVVCP